MKKETLALIDEAEAKIRADENINHWSDMYIHIYDLGLNIHESSKSFIEENEEVTAAVYVLCKRINNDYAWESYKTYSEFDPENIAKGEYLELIEMCKLHESEVPFDDFLKQLTADWVVKFYEEEWDDESN